MTTNKVKTLECHSKGDTRFSALYAKVTMNIRGNSQTKTIEEWYQESKFFENRGAYQSPKKVKALQKEGQFPTAIYICNAKHPVNLLSEWYTLLWVMYFKANPDLLKHAREFEAFNDPFAGKNTVNSQADVIEMCATKGLKYGLEQCKTIYDIITTYNNSLINETSKANIEQLLMWKGPSIENAILNIIKLVRSDLPKADVISKIKDIYGTGGGTFGSAMTETHNNLGIMITTPNGKYGSIHYTWGMVYDLYHKTYCGKGSEAKTTLGIIPASSKQLFGMDEDKKSEYGKLYNSLLSIINTMKKKYEIYEVITGSTSLNDFLAFSAAYKTALIDRENKKHFYASFCTPYHGALTNIPTSDQLAEKKKLTFMCQENAVKMTQHGSQRIIIAKDKKSYKRENLIQRIIDESEILLFITEHTEEDLRNPDSVQKKTTDYEIMRSLLEQKKIILLNPIQNTFTEVG